MAKETSTHHLVIGKEQHKFSAAHMTVFSDGTKEPLHGHNYQVVVSIELASVKFESFFDLGIVKKIVASLCSQWDNRLLLASGNPYFRIVRHDSKEIEFILSGKRYVVPSDEIALLPVDNIAVEPLAMLFLELFSAEIRDPKANLIRGLEVTITESAGQGGTCRKIFETDQ